MGVPVVVDPAMPADEIRFEAEGQEVGRIINLGPSEEAEHIRLMHLDLEQALGLVDKPWPELVAFASGLVRERELLAGERDKARAERDELGAVLRGKQDIIDSQAMVIKAQARSAKGVLMPRDLRRAFWALLVLMEDMDASQREAICDDLVLIAAQADQCLRLVEECAEKAG